MKQKGIDRLEILKQLHRETGLPVRYVYTAYDTIKKLPSHITFGGLALQRLREQAEITREEFHMRRNNLLACRGDASRKGNLCLQLNGKQLRINIGPHQWVRLPISIPKKYEPHLANSPFYMVALRRRSDCSGYDARITVEIEEPKIEEPKRVMMLDINSGHVDFSVAEKGNLKPVVFGRFNCHQFLDARQGKKRILIHCLVNKVRNIAKHYRAEVVAGRMKTLHSKGRRKTNRKAYGMNQFRLRQIMDYKLPLNGVRYYERSEAYTSKVGAKLVEPLGLDVHKAAAYAFAIKVIDYPQFLFLRGVRADEGDGIPSVGLNEGSGSTILHQVQCLMHNELGTMPSEATPNLGKGGWLQEPFQTDILQVKV